MEGSTPEIRVGDDERRAIDARLQTAHAEGRISLTEYDERSAQCWAARTRGDLDVLTRDLPAPAPDPAASRQAAVPVQEQTVRQTRRSARDERGPLGRIGSGLGSLAVIGVLVYAGVNVLGADDGSVVLGDRTVTSAPGQQRVEVGMLLGDVTVVVPDGTHVRTTGTVVAGKVRCPQVCGVAAPGAPELVVDASGALGDVRILTATEQAALPPGRDGDDSSDNGR